MVRVKLFEDSSISFLDRKVNEFLQGMTEVELVDIKLVSSKRDNTSSSAQYVAMVILREKF
jgi:hypothetical protein